MSTMRGDQVVYRSCGMRAQALSSTGDGRPMLQLHPAAGSINIPGNKSANYTFTMDSDDGSLLYIDGEQIISDPGA